MTAFGIIPPEPPRQNRLDACAPLFADAVRLLLADLTGQGYPPRLFETLRTNERQAWLYGFGRDYDDGRGIVTGAATAFDGWHFYGVACDVIHRDRMWNAPGFFAAMRKAMPRYGLGICTVSDYPHCQWLRCKKRPSAKARQLYEAGGLEAVWAAVHANT